MAVTNSLLIFRPQFYLVALLHLWTVVVLLKATLKWADAAEIYANTWAVQIDGGPEEADRIAAEHGFINHGNSAEGKMSSQRKPTQARENMQMRQITTVLLSCPS
ncbi:Proprotein convertase subtilisin/kexin type 6 [Takifugu flavidus]|uniref:Proprotein convertase subtilisin/kexin type 6 n=1 Tax=Takifugu flavidus TaxID=433684 RepID=A0A5C6P9H2_9TELE|nr:Proprotein convertase subtilisin/kexin type 6 [Takifugu flavidus]